MSISVSGQKLHVNLAIPLPHQYRGGGVAIFRISNGQPEVLLGLRANSPGQGTWSFPGGQADDKERLMSAAVREFREETGIQLYRRYITKTGIFHIKNCFFEWDTIIVESTQNISIKKEWVSAQVAYGGEFLSLEWIPVSKIGNYKLHHWVTDVIDLYQSGNMIPYTPKPAKAEVDALALAVPNRRNRVKTVQQGASEHLLFGMTKMALAKVGRDGTKYFQSRHQVKSQDS
jgi:8-oxo-dGTP pyrophosphatase MutT (NUDIX family)